MKTKKVLDLMVPLSEYAKVPVSATLAETVAALVLAQKGFDPERYRHRAILVVDEKDDVVGKINQTSILKALEPKYFEKLGLDSDMGIHRLSNYFLKSMVDKYNLFKEPFDEACKRAAQLSIEKIMHLPKAGEFIDKNDTMGEAIHRLVLGSYQSLLVQDGGKVIGILRLTDVFSAVAAEMNPPKSTVP